MIESHSNEIANALRTYGNKRFTRTSNLMFVDFSVQHFVENELYFVDAIKVAKAWKMNGNRAIVEFSLCVCHSHLIIACHFRRLSITGCFGGCDWYC